MPCSEELQSLCAGKNLVLQETFNWPKGDEPLIQYPSGVDPAVACRSSEPSSCDVLEDGAELIGAGGIYRTED
jgi:hypothetical protein